MPDSRETSGSRDVGLQTRPGAWTEKEESEPAKPPRLTRPCRLSVGHPSPSTPPVSAGEGWGGREGMDQGT